MHPRAKAAIAVGLRSSCERLFQQLFSGTVFSLFASFPRGDQREVNVFSPLPSMVITKHRAGSNAFRGIVTSPLKFCGLLGEMPNKQSRSHSCFSLEKARP